ncbi:MAG: hypothetical protein IT260_09315 [Saprospiraceae bacterium]|nr:hypothetical protein [Saprospiraceae bacterium]
MCQHCLFKTSPTGHPGHFAPDAPKGGGSESLLDVIFKEAGLESGAQQQTADKGMRAKDPVSRVRLAGLSLQAGTSVLAGLGLVRLPGPSINGAASYLFVDGNVIRVRWMPRNGLEPAHWTKYEPSGHPSFGYVQDY